MARSKTKWSEMDTPIVHVGKAITLPDDPTKMGIRDAIDALERKYQDEEREVSVCEWISNAHPLDAAVAFVKALKNLHGFASCVSTPGFFGPNPPEFMTVRTGYGPEDSIQVPMGDFKVPGVDHYISTCIQINSETRRTEFAIYACIPNREKGIISALAVETRRIVKAESIYKGKALSIRVEKGGELNQTNPPQFMDVADTTESNVLFDSDTMHQIQTNVLTPIKQTAEVQKHHIPLGRGILLEGPYGTGKSLTARVTAHVCVENAWTFVLLDRVQGLKEALEFAQRYAPSVVFAEDIDRVMGSRTEEANDLINTISGVASHCRNEVMIVLTTNHVDKIDQTILRPGRLDAVISLRPPNADTVERLIRYYGRELLQSDTDLTQASVELSGQIPAVIRETVERAKLSMIYRGGELIAGEDIVVATKTMKAHMKLLEPKTPMQSPGEQLLGVVKGAISEKLEEHFEKHVGVREQERMLGKR